MDELKQTPEIETSPAPACGGCEGCEGGCCAGKASEEALLAEAVDEALAEELLPEEPEAPEEPAASPADNGRVRVVDIHFRSGGKVYFFDPDGLELSAGDHVVMDTARGAEYGICASGCHMVASSEVVAPLRKVLRVATAQDEKVAADNREKEKKAFDVCQQKIQEHKLDMQLVSAECAFDGSKILFFFTADGRVDFRELVKNLASVFRTRIELRQIGVRDKAKMVGGLGVCGRPFCCSQFLDDFQPVSIKMAKTQNLSLNPTKISGTCGRLMCCLKYEQDAYEDLLKTVPKPESFVDTPDGRGTVCDVNLLRQTVRVRMEDHPETIGAYPTSEIAVLRNGKAKKNDLPIPREIAPISSKPRAARKAEPAPKEDTLMPIVFKKLDEYFTEAAPGQAPAVPEEAEKTEKTEQTRRRSRRKRKSTGGEGRPEGAQEPVKQEPRQEAKQPKPERPRQERKPRENREAQNPRPQNAEQRSQNADAPAAEGGESKPKSGNRRRHYRGRRPKNPNGGGQTPPAQE